MKNQSKRPTVTFEQLSYSNMLTLNALVELLTEKGVITKPEILERVKKLQSMWTVRSVSHVSEIPPTCRRRDFTNPNS